MSPLTKKTISFDPLGTDDFKFRADQTDDNMLYNKYSDPIESGRLDVIKSYGDPTSNKQKSATKVDFAQ